MIGQSGSSAERKRKKHEQGLAANKQVRTDRIPSIEVGLVYIKCQLWQSDYAWMGLMSNTRSLKSYIMNILPCFPTGQEEAVHKRWPKAYNA